MDRQTDDVRPGAIDPWDESRRVALDAVAARLAHRLARADVVGDLPIRHARELDASRNDFGELPAVRAHHNRRKNVMRPS